MDTVTAFGRAVKLRRVQLDVSQEALADKAEMSRSFVSGIERGEKKATISSVYKLAIALDTMPSSLWLDAERLMNSQ